MSIPENMTVQIDGETMRGADARIPIFDHGLLYGDGLFEAMRIQARRIFRLDRHLARLEAGAKSIGLTLPGGVAGMREVVLDTARAHGEADGYCRLIVTRGDGPLGIDPATCEKPRVICIVGRVQLYPPEKLERGIALATVSIRRPSADTLDPRVKSLNYLASVLAKREATLRGADEALVLNDAGLVAEASGANLFAVLREELVTPPATQGALEGITRGAVLDLAGELGIAASERPLGRFDLFASDELFVTGTAARLVPVASLDGQPVGTSTGRSGRPITRQLTEALEKLAGTTGVAF